MLLQNRSKRNLRRQWRAVLAAIVLTVAPTQVFAQHNTLTEQEVAEGWELLFDGKDMAKWRNFKSDQYP